MMPALSETGVTVELQDASDADGVPDPEHWRRWIGAACARAGNAAGCVTVRLVGLDESAGLNHDYRGKAGPTNVLAFPAPDAGEAWPADGEIGDLVICVPVVFDEAAAQRKPVEAHMAHMAVHGTLHLLGHDHGDDATAAAMEALETDILQGLGYPDPYRET